MPTTGSQTIADLLTQNHAYGLGLHGYGISVIEESGRTLAEACEARGLHPGIVVTTLESQAQARHVTPQVQHMPIELVIRYLRHMHGVFIKQRLPFLRYLISGLETDADHHVLGQDLQLIFPLFAEDFIVHIYEEEDQLFTYIGQLLEATAKGAYLSRYWFLVENHSIASIAGAHEVHDDEMAGIRRLTDDYRIQPGMPLPLQMLYYELTCFERDLRIHAGVENNVLFPKALKLEAYVRKTLQGLAKYN